MNDERCQGSCAVHVSKTSRTEQGNSPGVPADKPEPVLGALRYRSREKDGTDSIAQREGPSHRSAVINCCPNARTTSLDVLKK